MKFKTAFVAALILLIDRISKLIILKYLADNDSFKLINNFLYFTYVKNTGGAFSILSGRIWIFLIVSIAMFCFLIWLIKDEKKFSLYKLFMYGLVIGGVIGNFIDRAVYGYVIDFIHVDLGNYVFPIFNISDIAIVIGVGLMMIDVFKKDNNYEN